MNKLPLNWCECKLEDVLEYEQPTKYIVSNTNYSDSGIPVLTAGKSFLLGYTNDTTGVFDKSELPVIIFDDFTTATKLVDFPFKVKSSAMKILHANKNVNILYFYYLMQTIHYKADTHKRYWISEYAKQEVKLPPLAEQGRIVGKIEEMFEKIDAGVEKLKSAQEKIKQYKQSVLHSAFTGKLYKTTEWKELPLKDVCIFKQGIQVDVKKQIDYEKEGYAKFLRIVNYTQPEHSEFKYVINDFSHYIKADDLVMVRYGATAGFVGRGYEGILANNLFSFVFDKEKINSDFLYYFLLSQYKNLNYSVQGGAMPAISFGIIGKILFSLPTIPEQKRIVEEIEKRFEKADNMLEAVEKSLKSAEQLKQSVLKKTFEGKLVPQDPNDEPAFVLLDRIKSEKQQNEKAKGKRNDRK